METGATISILLVLWIAVNGGREIKDELPLLTLLAMATVRLLPAFNTISTSLTSIKFFGACIPVLVKELSPRHPISRAFMMGERQKENQNLPLVSDIELSSVEYQYPNTSKKVFNKISIKASLGHSIGIKGQSGAGKSTLIDIIMGLKRPDSGRYLINGEDFSRELETGARPSIFNKFGYVPQDYYLLDNTIRRNIAFGISDGEIDESKILDATKKSRISEFIANLPCGLDTVVGDNGAFLSGGQRQRLALARALYFLPDVLVLDEATGSLDSSTEIEIMDTIFALQEKHILIIISHREEIIQQCSMRYSLVSGELIEC
jgi:ABC-type bacteriocin/lantibiotic exporter with double-glycine peptidase domain